MKTKLIYDKEVNIYTDSEEDIYAQTLTSKHKYYVTIFNKDKKILRTWNGTAFENCNEIIPRITGEIKEEIEYTEAELKMASIDRFKELIYTNGTLTQLNVWTDNQKITKLYQIDYTYTGEDLTQIQTQRISDGFIYTKNLTYDNGNLVSINITI